MFSKFKPRNGARIIVAVKLTHTKSTAAPLKRFMATYGLWTESRLNSESERPLVFPPNSARLSSVLFEIEISKDLLLITFKGP